MTDIENDVDLIDLTRAEDFPSDNEFLRCFAEAPEEKAIIDKLGGPGAHLLEGPRGVGKSTLMRKAELDLDDRYGTLKVLSVYVSFKASLLVESGVGEVGYDPFVCWVAAKVLDAFHKKARQVNLFVADSINERYKRLLGLASSPTPEYLEDAIRDLQSLAIAQTPQERATTAARLKTAGLSRLANIEAVADFIRQTVSDEGLARLVFLFDEAAHTFDAQQQETFFQFFKLMHGGQIAAKAATYPGVTTYGRNFEIGHDAVRISLGTFEENLPEKRELLRGHFRELLRKRVSTGLYNKMTKQGDGLDLLIHLSHGNPRLFLQTVSKWNASKELSKRSALQCSNEFVAAELESYHAGLKQRLPRFASHIDLGLSLVKAHLVPEIQKKNQNKGTDPSIQTIYFTIESSIPHKVLRAIELLQYSGFLFAKGVVKIRMRKTAPRYALHLGVAANEKVFHSSMSRDPDLAIKKLSTVDYREFYASDQRFQQLIDDHQTAESCPNGHRRQVDGTFCPVCGLRFATDHLVELLLNASIDELAFSEWLRAKVAATGAITVRAVLALTETRLQDEKGIGPKRARLILNTAEEYISG